MTLDWFFSNGTKVGTTNRNIREGHFENQTASLQIASDRRLSYCDSGVYACRANQSSKGRVEEKTFTLTIGGEFEFVSTYQQATINHSKACHIK